MFAVTVQSLRHPRGKPGITAFRHREHQAPGFGQQAPLGHDPSLPERRGYVDPAEKLGVRDVRSDPAQRK